MKTYNIYCADEHTFEYVFTECTQFEEKHYELRRSGADHWTEPHEVLLKAIDTGNEFKIEEKIGKTLDYSQFSELRLFLNLINHTDEGLMGTYQVIDASTIHEI